MTPITNDWLLEQVKKEQAYCREFEEAHKDIFEKVENAISSGRLVIPDIELAIKEQIWKSEIRLILKFVSDSPFSYPDFLATTNGTTRNHKDQYILGMFEKYHSKMLKELFPTMMYYTVSLGAKDNAIHRIQVILPQPKPCVSAF